ncbi:L-proline glycine betaine ABC transport system permease protein ProV [Desulfosporosinus sp. I2]|uniref:ABC transporter ATP-binding protein n=1 Tax=Desulfosporosinus sp. I2 TaxID=1617025 RepID=UPI0005EDAE19|nr:betaine/proline/choline family ABC transporter ATP-binding protein [Desulfosporosinus sp. I2]KJR49412.1 L-proline glycine betaine ABC transport system permease protein ProV [Desulfosporosinus sp. I2]
MIRFDKVSKVFSDGFQALDNLSFHIDEGELFVLIGPSGCGKTTTMKMINRLNEPSQGIIWIGNKDISKENPVELRRNIGYVIQHIGLLPHMTIGENVALVPKLKKVNPSSYQQRVDDLLSMVGLDPNVYRDRYPAELSGGQQQRVGVIRALAAEPPIILMDEPFSALDPISREQLQDELIRLQQEIKKTIVFVTHDMDEALKIADRICIMQDGKIVQLDSPDHILRHPANDFVRSFIGEDRLNAAGILPDVEEVMIKPVTAGPSRGLAEAIKLMQKQKVDSLLITGPSNKYLGIVKAWDIQQHYRDEKLTLKDIMVTDFATIQRNRPLSEAIDIISENNVSNLPVLSAEGELVGVITRASLVDVMADKYGNGTMDS